MTCILLNPNGTCGLWLLIYFILPISFSTQSQFCHSSGTIVAQYLHSTCTVVAQF